MHKFKITLLLLLVFLKANAAFSIESREEVKIGVILPLTGNQAVWGIDGKNVIALLNQNPSLLGSRKYKFIIEDGACGVGNNAITAAQKLINVEGVKFLLVACSGEILQIARLVESKKVLTITFFGGHPDVKNLGDYIFRTFIDTTKSEDLIVQKIEEEKRERIAIFSEEAPFTQGIKNDLTLKLQKKIIFNEDYPVDEQDFRSLILRIKAKSPDALCLNTASPKTYITFIKQLNELQYKLPIYIYRMAGDKESISVLGDLQSGVTYTDLPDNLPTNENFNFIYNLYQKTFGEPTVKYAVRASFDAVMLLTSGIERFGINPDKVKEYLYTEKFNGGLGQGYRFDKNGDVEGVDFVIRRIE